MFDYVEYFFWYGYLKTVPLSKKKREDSPSGHQHPSSLKPRGHIPVSERQQFALLKRMETKESPSERSAYLVITRIILSHLIFFNVLYSFVCNA